MSIERPVIPGNRELNCYLASITSGQCANVNLAFDDDPTTAAVFGPLASTVLTPYAIPAGAPTASYNYNDPNNPTLYPNIPVHTQPHWFGQNFPAGNYYIVYVSGDMNWGGPITDLWNAGVLITDGNGNNLDWAESNLGDHPYFFAATGEFAAAFGSAVGFTGIPFNHVGGPIGICNPDGATFDNLPGTGNPTYALVGPLPRFIQVDFGKNFWLGALTYLADGPGASNAGVDYLGPYGTPPPDIPLVMPPLPINGGLSQYIWDPPVLARGVVIYPDAFAPSSHQSQYPTMDLYQVQVYESVAEDIVMAGPATGAPLELGISASWIYPYAAGSSYASLVANLATRAVLARPQMLDCPLDLKNAKEYGGESIYPRGSYPYEMDLTWKLTFQRNDFFALYTLLQGNYEYAPGTGTNQLLNNQQQLWTPNLQDDPLYFSAIFQSIFGDPTMLYIIPKAKAAGIARSLDRTKITDMVLTFEVCWDDYWIRQDGASGGAAFEQQWNGGQQNTNPFS